MGNKLPFVGYHINLIVFTFEENITFKILQELAGIKGIKE